MPRWLGIAGRVLGGLARGQRGGLFLETVVALALFGVLGSAVLTSVQASSSAKQMSEVQATADNMLRNQIEYLYEQAYQPPGGTYQTVSPPAGYSVTVDALVHYETSTDIEKVRVMVLRDGQPVKTLETIRTNR